MPQSCTIRTNGQNSWWGDDIGMPSPLPHPCALCWCLIVIKCSLTWEYRHKTEQCVPFVLVSVPILLYTSSQFNMTGQQAHIATLIVWVCTAAEKMHHKEPNGLVGPFAYVGVTCTWSTNRLYKQCEEHHRNKKGKHLVRQRQGQGCKGWGRRGNLG